MRLSLAFIFFFCFAYCDAQLPVNIKFTNYNRANGLPEENINSIVQDSRGFIWIGSEEGLFRFDGLNFKSWYADPNDPAKFKNNKIRVIGEYRPGTLIITSNFELWQINIASQQITPVNEFRGKRIYSVIKINNDNCCIATEDSLFITDNKMKPFYRTSLALYFIPGTSTCFPLDSVNCLLYSLNPNRYYLFNYVDRRLTQLKIDNSMLEDRTKFFTPTLYDKAQKRIYFTAYFNGIFYCDFDLPAKTNYVPVRVKGQTDGSIRSTLLLDSNRMMQGGENGLYLLDTGEKDLFIRQHVFKDKIILGSMQSKEGDIWLCTQTGVIRFSLTKPHVNSWTESLHMERDDEFKAIIRGNNGRLYFFTQEKSLNEYDESTNQVINIEKQVGYCWSAIKRNDEIIATGGGRRLLIYNTLTKKISYPSFLDRFYTKNTDVVTLVFQSKNGDCWYSSNGSVGIIRNPAGTDQYIQYSNTLTPASFRHNYVHCATEDKHGNIWFGSNRMNEVLKWNGSKQQFEGLIVADLLPGYDLKYGINNLLADPDNNLWIALDGAGLLKYNMETKKGTYYDINKGLPTDAVYGMTYDNKGRIWLATGKGISCYLPEKDKIINFTTYDGFPEDDFEGFGIFYDKERKLLYVGARRSLSYFDPDVLVNRTLSNQSPVFIDEMLVNGKQFYSDNEKNIRLKTKENNIEFNFAVPDLNRSNQLIFQYQLKGVSNDWIDLGEKRSVTFNNLSHGHYTLSVRSKYKGIETWNETAYPFSFSIKTPLQKTWWFRLLIMIIAGVLVWFIIRSYYKQKLERERSVLEKQQAIEKERTRIATDMHDDFGASLSRIKFLSEKLQLYKTGGDSGSTDLQKISLYSDEMAEKMNEIVWALNQRYDSLEDLVSFCRSYASEYLQDKSIKLNFTTSGITERKIQGETRRNIFLVIKEALHNVVKHAGATEVNISFAWEKDLKVTIADNGRGFDTGTIHQFANGLENMKKRMADINGSIHIENTNGTQLSISVPV